LNFFFFFQFKIQKKKNQQIN